MEQKDLGKTSLGIQPNVAACLSYLLGVVTGLLFYLLEKDNKFVRFHAMQSIVVFGALFIIQIAQVSVLFFLPWGLHYAISSILGLVGLVLWIVLMIKAYQGELFKLPVAGDVAEKHS